MTQSPPPQGGTPPGGYLPPEDAPQPGAPSPSEGDYPPPGEFSPSPGGFPPPSGAQGSYSPPGNFAAGGEIRPPFGGYPPPPQGGFPPPGGGFPPSAGYPPAGYPPGGFGGAPGELSIGDAFSWAWDKFSKNAAALILPTFAYGAVVFVLIGIIVVSATVASPESGYSYASDDDYGIGFEITGVGFVILVVGLVVLLILMAAFSSAYINGILDVANGVPVTPGSFFKPRLIGPVIAATLLVGIAAGIGSLACYVPGLIVSIFAFFTTPALIDRNLSAINAIKTSIHIAKNNFVQVLLVWLLYNIVISVGSFLCGVGLLVAAPIAILFQVYAFRRLTGGQVAPLTP